MQVLLYLVCTVLIIVKSEKPRNNNHKIHFASIDRTSEHDTIGYLLPKLVARNRPSNEWNSNPKLYVFAQKNQVLEERSKRHNKPSLSIVNSLDVLRDRLLLEVSRKKEREGFIRNRNYLSEVGKRAAL